MLVQAATEFSEEPLFPLGIMYSYHMFIIPCL